MKCKYGYEYCEMEAWSICSGCLNDLKESQKDVADLNRLLRDVGWGQGEIDTAAVIAEENEQLRGVLRKLVEAAKSKEYDGYRSSDDYCTICGWKKNYKGRPQPHDWTCPYAASIAEAERLLGDAT